jgi:hypothetical protein
MIHVMLFADCTRYLNLVKIESEIYQFYAKSTSGCLQTSAEAICLGWIILIHFHLTGGWSQFIMEITVMPQL